MSDRASAAVYDGPERFEHCRVDEGRRVGLKTAFNSKGAADAHSHEPCPQHEIMDQQYARIARAKRMNSRAA